MGAHSMFLSQNKKNNEYPGKPHFSLYSSLPGFVNMMIKIK